MTLQNRVHPDGSLHAASARGTFMGNRGRLHDPITKTLLSRRWALKAWLICKLSFNNRQREVMGHSYTELFFLDEVTAFSSGHRPCYECRRQAFKAYQAYWQKAFDLKKPPKAAEMDAILHEERLDGKEKRLHSISKNNLVDGVIILHENACYAVKQNHFLLWSFSGYRISNLSLDTLPNALSCLTPPTQLKILEAGYQPEWHDSARNLPTNH